MGKARNLKKRVSSYFVNRTVIGERTRKLIKLIKKIQYIKARNELEALLLEAKYIKKYEPCFNVKLTDGKTYPMIKITINDKYPKVLVARSVDQNPKEGKSLYFGPYPNPSSMRLVLHTIRRIFPFQSVNNHPKKICLYYHLGLCPCPAVFDSNELKKEYRKNIRFIITFLNGKLNVVTRRLEKERNNSCENENFEKAKILQQKIEAIKLITTPVILPFEYEINPNLKADLAKEETDKLKEELVKSEVDIQSLKRIECYDISNISGKHATGSMVVFINGEREKSIYRKFKINQSKPNDVLMLYEMISRRLRHNEWDLPDLMVIDGGKGQVSLAQKAIVESGLKIPIIGLAKKNERIITSDFREIKLSRESKALHFLQKIRDEAHRFAISYHKKLRWKTLIPQD
ncbi:MAG: UvrB/UvrC motif-containing protein [Candidatus Levyibacteriota bacterium]